MPTGAQSTTALPKNPIFLVKGKHIESPRKQSRTQHAKAPRPTNLPALLQALLKRRTTSETKQPVWRPVNNHPHWPKAPPRFWIPSEKLEEIKAKRVQTVKNTRTISVHDSAKTKTQNVNKSTRSLHNSAKSITPKRKKTSS